MWIRLHKQRLWKSLPRLICNWGLHWATWRWHGYFRFWMLLLDVEIKSQVSLEHRRWNTSLVRCWKYSRTAIGFKWGGRISRIGICWRLFLDLVVGSLCLWIFKGSLIYLQRSKIFGYFWRLPRQLLCKVRHDVHSRKAWSRIERFLDGFDDTSPRCFGHH